MSEKVPFKQKSGYQKRKEKKQREQTALKQRAVELGLSFDDPSDPDDDAEKLAAIEAEKRFIDSVRKLGDPPDDPVETIIYANRMTALVMTSAAIDPYSITLERRRKAVLDAVRAIGMTNSKAVDKARMRRIEERLGLVEKDPEDGLEECSDANEALRA